MIPGYYDETKITGVKPLKNPRNYQSQGSRASKPLEEKAKPVREIKTQLD